MKQTGRVDGYPSTKPAPCGRTISWGRHGCYAWHRRSTTGLAHGWPISTPDPCLSQPSSGSALADRHASIAATTASAACAAVRQSSALPTVSSGFHLTVDTLPVQLTLPLAGCVEDLHLQVGAPCRAHQKKQKARSLSGLFYETYAGDHLISHTLTRAVPSAQRGLTSVFGMGTGGTLAVWSPANLRRLQIRLRL